MLHPQLPLFSDLQSYLLDLRFSSPKRFECLAGQYRFLEFRSPNLPSDHKNMNADSKSLRCLRRIIDNSIENIDAIMEDGSLDCRTNGSC
jgi:hypothetical protein